MNLKIDSYIIELIDVSPITYDVELGKWSDIILTTKSPLNVDDILLTPLSRKEVTLNQEGQTTKIVVKSWVIGDTNIKIEPKYCELIELPNMK